MNENTFEKIKRKERAKAIALSVLFGGSFALLLVGAVLLPFKLLQIPLAWYYTLAIGVGGALVATAICLFQFLPRERALAKKLDKDYGLGEKTLTMLEYQNQGSELVLLQRESAKEALNTLPKRKPSPFAVIKTVLIPLLSVALFATAILWKIPTPPIVEEPPVTEPVYTLSEIQKARLNKLIKDVENSSLSAGVKLVHGNTLKALLAALEQENIREEDKDNAVTVTLQTVVNTTKTVNTYDKISAQLALSEQTLPLGETLIKSASIYNLSANKIGDVNKVNEKEATLFDDIVTLLITDENGGENDGGAMQPLYTALFACTWESFSTTVNGYANALFAGAENSQTPQTDALKVALLTLSEELKGISAEQLAQGTEENGYGLTAWQERITTACENALYNTLPDAMKAQAYNCMMEEFIVQTLYDIFKISLESEDGDGSGGNEDAGGSTGGGATGGNVNIADAKIYDCETEGYISLKEAIAKYQPIINELLSREDVSDELKDFVTNYFDYLASPPKN